MEKWAIDQDRKIIATRNSNFIKSLLLILPLFSILSCGAEEAGKAVEHIQTKSESTLVIRPSMVTANDVITISFPRNHPKKMSIRSPSNEWYVVHEKSERIYLLPKNLFSKATSVQKKVPEIKGVKWVDGKRVVGPVFNEPGEYLLYMADNLETEPENTFHLMNTVIYQK